MTIPVCLKAQKSKMTTVLLFSPSLHLPAMNGQMKYLLRLFYKNNYKVFTNTNVRFPKKFYYVYSKAQENQKN